MMTVAVLSNTIYQAFTLSDALCAQALMQAKRTEWAKKQLHRPACDKVGEISLGLCALKPADPLFARIARELSHTLDVEAHVIRLHCTSPSQSIARHTDDAYPDSDTVIIRLNDAPNRESRFLINDEFVPEAAGLGYYMSEHTPHEVTTGEYERFTIAAWVYPR